jgi:hypothetical protein
MRWERKERNAERPGRRLTSRAWMKAATFLAISSLYGIIGADILLYYHLQALDFQEETSRCCEHYATSHSIRAGDDNRLPFRNSTHTKYGHRYVQCLPIVNVVYILHFLGRLERRDPEHEVPNRLKSISAHKSLLPQLSNIQQDTVHANRTATQTERPSRHVEHHPQ